MCRLIYANLIVKISRTPVTMGIFNRLRDVATRLSWPSFLTITAATGDKDTAPVTGKDREDPAHPSVAPVAQSQDTSTSTSTSTSTPPQVPSRFSLVNHYVIIVLLTGTLLIQLAVTDRAHLSQIQRYRPTVDLLCRLLHCAVPLWHEPTAMTMLHRQISAVPSRPGILQVQISFRNDARWPQAWPDIALRLSDAEGRLIGARRFQPADYLGRPVIDNPPLLPGQSALSTFYIREPAANTAAFTFEFY